MAIEIHTSVDIRSATPEHDTVLDDIFAGQVSKFIMTKKKDPELIIFPGWAHHIDIAEKKKREIRDLLGYQAAGTIYVPHQHMPLLSEHIDMRYDSKTFRDIYGYDKPSDAEIAEILLQESKEKLAEVLTSVLQCRMDNDKSEQRRISRSA